MLKARSLFAVIGFVACVSTAGAQTFPSKPITIITHSAPAGPADGLARAVMPDLSASLGQPVVVVNKPGGSGKIGIQTLLNAPRDGYTIFTVSYTHLITLPLADPAAGYDPNKDFELLTNGQGTPVAVVVHKSLPVTNMKEFIAYAKTHGDKLNYGSFGVGSALHFGTEVLLDKLGGVKLTHVPYKSEALAIPDLLAGNVQFMLTSGAIKPHVESGAVRILGTTGEKRWSQFPDAPTMVEQGIDFPWVPWTGFAAAAGIPLEAKRKLQTALVHALSTAPVKQAFDRLGAESLPSTAEEFAATVRRDRAMVAAAMKTGRIKLDDR